MGPELRWAKWNLDRLFSEYFCFTLSVSFHQCSVLHLPPSLYHLSSWHSLEIKLFPLSPLFPHALLEAVVAYFKIRLSPFCTSLCSLKCYINQQTKPYTSNILFFNSALHVSAVYTSHNQVSIGSKQKKKKGRGLS